MKRPISAYDARQSTSQQTTGGLPPIRIRKRSRYNVYTTFAVGFIIIFVIVRWHMTQSSIRVVDDSPPAGTYLYQKGLPPINVKRNNSNINQQEWHTESFYAAAEKVESNITVVSRYKQKCRKNAIVLLAQKKHATYDRDSYGLLRKSLGLLSKNYLSINGHADNTDIFIFHTGDFDEMDLHVLEPIVGNRTGMMKLVNLDASPYWSLPPWHAKDNQSHWAFPDIFPIGYRHMCRWFGVKIWQFFEDLNNELGCNYRYIFRIDEDSFILSPIEYDVFDYMRINQFAYGYRLCAYEMDYNRYIRFWFQKWRRKTNPKRQITRELCGFYNNFFVADLDFFRSGPVQKYLRAIDRQGFIYRKRYGDLMLHTTAVYAFAESNQIHRFLDFTYQHVTIDHILHPEQGCVVWGGIQAGYNDIHAEQNLGDYYKSRVVDRRCTANMTYMEEKDLSPSYQHVPKGSKGKVRLKTIVAGKVELPNQGIHSG